MRRWGDRFDGKLIRDVDALHFLMPILYPSRCDNEGYISETIDLTNALAFIEKKNKTEEDFNYTVFQLVVAAIMKTLVLRPKLNRFIVNGSMYQRNSMSVSFVVKKRFADSSEEGLAFIEARREDTLETIHEKMREQIYESRHGGGGDAVESIDILRKMPRILGKNILRFVHWTEQHGIVIPAITKGDPGYSSVMITNLGSIGMKAGYHHLSNWGTNSIFIVMGIIKKRPFIDDNDKTKMRMSVDLGLTVDERIADGYYYSKSVKILKHLLEHPELLEDRLDCHPKKSSSRAK